MPCGCSFDILDEKISDMDGLPSLGIDVYNLPNCLEVWKLFQSGNIKGVFQLETYLGQHWSKEIKPNSIEDVSAIISAIRPGVSKAILDGKSLTQHFADRKNGLEDVVYPDPSLEEILKSTRGILIYQEQSILIARKLAGFDLKEADILRRAMGKKDAELMTKIEGMFIDGCKKIGLVTEEKAKEIFGWIRKSERYNFNLSHGIMYAQIGYATAYIKHHFPLHFYTSWLEYAKEKMDPQKEISQLVSDAKLFNVSIKKPDIRLIHHGEDFILHNKKVYFGLRNIKHVGEAVIKKFITLLYEIELKLDKKIDKFSWNEFLYYISPNVNKKAINNMIMAGSLELFGLSRRKMLHEFSIFSELSEKEQNFVINNSNDKSLETSLKNLIENCKLTPKRKDIINSLIMSLNKPMSELIDRPGWISKTEEELLGTSLSFNNLDGLDTVDADSTCLDIINGKSDESIICIEIKEVKEILTKKGKMAGSKMAFLKVADHSADLESVVCFADKWEVYSNLLYKYNTVLLYGQKTNQNSFAIKLAKQI